MTTVIWSISLAGNKATERQAKALAEAMACKLGLDGSCIKRIMGQAAVKRMRRQG